MNFKSNDVFYFQLLLINKKKMQFFDNLKIVNAQIEKTFDKKIDFQFFIYK